MQSNKPIGQLLRELGFITAEQIEVALDVQNVSQKFFGEILVDLDFITANEIAEAMAIQNNLTFIDLDTLVPSNEALALVSENMAHTRLILPLKLENETLTIATQDANDLMTLDYLRKETRKQIKFVIADKNKIARYAQIYYHQLQNPIELEIRSLAKKAAAKTPVDIVRLVDLLLNNAIKDRATDIHLTPEGGATHVFYRIDGVMRHYYSIPIELHAQITARIKIISELDIAEQRKPQDGAFSYDYLNEKFDLRVSTLPSSFGENIVMRLLGKNSSLFSLSHLGFTPDNIQKIEHYFSKPYGVILITGPTGSGKTTTLYSALRKINPLQKNILTIEDPIEYRFSFVKQTQVNRKAGYMFDTALRSFMRQDPDVMLVGEIRDSETAELAVRASITGHLVLSTLHTNDAVGTIPRLEDLGIPHYLIGSALLAVIGQRLIRKLCPHCKKSRPVDIDELLEYGIDPALLSAYPTHQVFEAAGCPQCRNTGYSGRMAIIEIFEVDEHIESLISANVPTLDLLKAARKRGMYSMRDDGYIKVLQGLSTFSEIDRVVN
ncbi:MAG: GspE/PulE family protein [Sulfuricurvum sp.]|nr:GspE/PulE family protein [Sulfuricurvum sp.]